MPYQFLADAVLVVHFGVVVFIVVGLVIIVAGNIWHWSWVNRWGFRLAHLAAIGIVVAQSWLGQICPLTTLESWLRVQAGSPTYRKSFVEYWVHRTLYFDAPFWMFQLAYTIFALMVLGAWRYFPPKSGKRK